MSVFDAIVPQSQHFAWYKCDNDNEAEALAMAKELIDEVRRIDFLTVDRQQTILECAALYGETGNWPGSTSLFTTSPLSSITGINILSNAVDTLVSEVTQTTPAPMASPTGGDYDQQLKAEYLNSYWECAFELHDMRRMVPLLVRDAVLYGLGIVRVEPDDALGCVAVERVFPLHLLVDDVSCVDVPPRDFYIVRAVDKDYLVDLYPDREDLIRWSAPPPTIAYNGLWSQGAVPGAEDRHSQVVGVIEAWHCQAGPDAPPGRHVTAVSQGVLTDDEYEFEDPPLAFLRPIQAQRGWWPEFMIRRASSLQRKLNKLARRVEDAQHLHARPIIFIDQGAANIKPMITNDVGNIIPVPGGGPMVRQFTPQSMNAEIYSWMDRLGQLIFEAMGISQMAAQSLKPAGLNSGAAIRAYNDTQSRRFINVERAYEMVHVDIARLMVRAERELAGSSRDAIIMRYGQRRRVSWRDIDLDDDDYQIRVMPASALPSTPHGRIQVLQEWLERNVIDDIEFVRLSGVPDLKRAREELTSPQEIIEWQLEMILSGEEDLEVARPMPEQNLQLCVSMAQLKLQVAFLRGCPNERLDLVRAYMAEAQHLLKLAMQPPPPALPGPPGPPGMGAPPVAPGVAPTPLPMPGGPPMPPPGPMPPGVPPMAAE